MRPRHIQRARIVLLISSLLLIAVPAPGLEPSPDDLGFQWGGALEIGYRFTDIEGENRYREVVNLDEGLKLFDLNLWFKDPNPSALADQVRFRLNGIGDPYPSGRLDVQKSKVYHLSADYREYDYFFNRRDVPSSTNDFNGLLLTDNHDFDQKRTMGRISLSVFPGDEIRLNFGYNFAQRTGENGVPRPFTFVPNFSQDVNEQYREFFGSIDFPLGPWDFHVKQSYWTYENKDEIGPFPPLLEKRDESVWTYVSTIKTHTRMGERWDLDAGYVVAHSEGDAQVNVFPPNLVPTGNGGVDYNTNIFELGLSHLLRRDLILHLDYRFHNFVQDGGTNTDLFSLPERVARTDYSLYAHTGTTQLEYMPFDNLTLRGGYRVQSRQIEAENFAPGPFEGGTESDNTHIISHDWVATAQWKPLKTLSLSGEYEGAAFDNPYTRISPEEEHIANLRVRYEPPVKGLNLRFTSLWKRKTNPDQEYRLDIQDYILAATYQPPSLQKLTLDACFTYERIRDREDILNEEGFIPSPQPPPLSSTFYFDSDAVIFSGGVSYEGIYKGLGGRFTGSYARTREEDSEEYYVTSLSFWYKNPWVIPIVTLERYRLEDFQSPKDSFAANLVTLSLRKEF